MKALHGQSNTLPISVRMPLHTVKRTYSNTSLQMVREVCRGVWAFVIAWTVNRAVYNVAYIGSASIVSLLLLDQPCCVQQHAR